MTAHTDYALRVLMSLAVAGDRLVTIEELATRHRVSKNHLMKVAQTLVALGVVEGIRGRTGGLRLARISHGLGCIGVSERVKLVLRERVEPGRRALPDAHTL